MKVRFIFLGALVLTIGAQILLFSKPNDLPDESLWASQARWFETGNPEMFDLREAYGHPGGPLIEAGIALHALGISYDDAIIVFEAIVDALLIAGIITMTYVLRREWAWTIAVIGLLFFDPLYLNATPPSMLAMLAGALLFLFTLWLYEQHEHATLVHFLYWSALAGALAATRAGIGGIFVVSCAVILAHRYGPRLAATLLAAAFAVFCVCDPFMWFIPIRHIGDIFKKIYVHYDGIIIHGHSTLMQVFDYTARGIIGAAAAVAYSIAPARRTAPAPRFFLGILLATTALVCGILFTSHFYTQRYFAPLAITWEILLPLFILDALPRLLARSALSPARRQSLAIGLISVIAWLPTIIMVYDFSISP